MRRRQVRVRAIKADGTWGSVDVFDLDDESFRAFVASRLSASGQIMVMRDDLAGEVVTLKEKKKVKPSRSEPTQFVTGLDELAEFQVWVREFTEDVALQVALAEDAEMMAHKGQQLVADLRTVIGDKWPHPDAMDSYVFLVSEIGEVGDALLRTGYGSRADYTRNNPSREISLAKELGDVYMMLCTLATCLEIDLGEALGERIEYLKGKHG